MAWTGAAASTAAIAWLDYVTGIEVRILPLYFGPISLAAWGAGRRGALTIALLCSLGWLTSNQLAGMRFSVGVWTLNLISQTAAFVAVAYLMSTLRFALERERTLSRTDALTKLANSRAFYEEAERMVSRSRRHRRALSLAYVDVDDFKKVNDSLGHQGGDKVLQAIAGVLQAAVRSGDLVARLGGDEFAILLEETDQDGARSFLTRTREQLRDALATSPRKVTISVGAVTFASPPRELSMLVQKADALMYAAKSAGKDRFHVELVADSAIASPHASPHPSAPAPPRAELPTKRGVPS